MRVCAVIRPAAPEPSIQIRFSLGSTSMSEEEKWDAFSVRLLGVSIPETISNVNPSKTLVLTRMSVKGTLAYYYHIFMISVRLSLLVTVGPFGFHNIPM